MSRTKETRTYSARSGVRVSQRDLPSTVLASVPESALYSDLVALEEKLDAMIARYHIEVGELMNSSNRTPYLLRVYMAHEIFDQHLPKTHATPPSWTLRVLGELWDPATNQKVKGLDYKFTDFFDRVIFQIDPRLYSGNNSTVEVPSSLPNRRQPTPIRTNDMIPINP
eukprot:TRINITY_DN66403_c3_g19_i2.p1 TRINITY_DN66403_c3_g19~~TRINITY_DN66403_c3_g19_i2.p1  ORF type:complete len:168 (+),score=53.05 TRINITY_DN66403_c3_g19_i2:36-539(+)